MAKLLRGSRRDIIAANVKMLRKQGMSERQATHLALKHCRKNTQIGKY